MSCKVCKIIVSGGPLNQVRIDEEGVADLLLDENAVAQALSKLAEQADSKPFRCMFRIQMQARRASFVPPAAQAVFSYK